MKRFILPVLICLLFICPCAFAKKKNKEPKLPPMVQTVEEWLEEAAAPSMNARKEIKETALKKDDKIVMPEEKPAHFEPYNVNAGHRELNLSDIHNKRSIRSPFVVSPDFNHAVYTETYYYPQRKQISSSIFLIELNGVDKKEKVQKANIFESERFELISTALSFLKDNFFSTLTVVDFSSDGKKLLVKEKRGSNKYGLYETYVWVYFFGENDPYKNECYINNKDFNNELLNYTSANDFLDNLAQNYNGETDEKYPKIPEYNDNENNQAQKNTRWYNSPPKSGNESKITVQKNKKGFPVRLNLLNEQIKAYWFDNKDLILNFIRWDIKPLGFNSANDNEIIVEAFGYSKEGNKISLGQWGVNLKDGTPRKISDKENVQVGAYGLILINKLN